MSPASRNTPVSSAHPSCRALRAASAAIVLAGLSLFGSPSYGSSPDRTKPLSPEAILRLSIDAERNLNMRGTETMIVQPPRGQNMLSMTRQVIRTRDGYTLSRWTDPPEQRGLTILDDGTWSKCYHPAEGFIKVSRSTPRPRNAREAARLVRLILRNYRVSITGIEPMASRSCYKLQLTPVHAISHMVQLWVDRQNGAVLSRREYMPNGDMRRVSSFNGVSFAKNQPVADLKKALPTTVRAANISRSQILRSFSDVRRKVGFEFCPPYSMPGGYEFEHAEIITLQGAASTCLRYTDGLAEITICQNRSSEARPNGYSARHLWVNAMGDNVVDLQMGSMNFYLVGRCEMDGLVAVTDALNVEKERSFLRNFVRNYRVPMETLVGFRNRGVGVDTMAALLAISRQANKPLSSLIELCGEGYGWAAIARRFRADAARILQDVRAFQCR